MWTELLNSSYFALFLIVALGFMLGRIKVRGISLDVSALGYDEEARYLFGDGRVIEEDPALLNLYLRVRAFFLGLKAHFPEGRSNDKEGA